MSFVHEDQEVANATKRLIEGELNLKDVFLSSDRAQVYAGDLWLEKITAALKDSKVVVLMLSKRSVGRPWVNFEAGGAWLTGKKIIPCCYGNLTKGSLPHPYAAIHALDLGETQDAYFLLESIYRHLQLSTVPPMPPFMKAIARAMKEKERKEKGDVVQSLRDAASDYYGSLRAALSTFEDED